MIWLVALGGALGSVSRFLLGPALQRALNVTFPYGTLFINITGSLLLGLVVGFATNSAAVSPQMRVFLAVGFCGGFTTFSAFSLETVLLVQEGQAMRAVAYVMASVLLSVTAAWVGLIAARQLLSR
jgi:fluoride exporter